MNYETYQLALTYVALCGVIGCGVVLFAISIWPFVSAAWDRMGAKRIRVLFLLSAIGFTFFGGAKHIIGTISYPRTDPEVWYLMDSGSYVTNDYVHVGFNRNLIVPATANFFVDGLSLEFTNQSDWATHSFNAYSNTFDNMSVPFDMAYPAATNYNWIAYTDWTPPPVVHTNGVAYVVWQIGVGKATNDLAMTRTGVYTNILSNLIKVAPNPAITNGPSNVILMNLNQETNND